MNTRKIAVVAAVAAAGFGLIGAGAGATFTDAVTTTQQVTAGSIDMQLTSDASGVTISTDKKTASFADLGPTQSTFSSGVVPTTITNHGNATANAIVLSAGDVHADNAASNALASEICVKIISPVGKGVAYDGKLSGLQAHPIQLQGPVVSGGTDSFSTEFYAGSGQCASLTNASEGGVVNPSVTVSYVG
ncbi:hypothetical protein [Terrabacter sp. 2YAF2]|uniref:hypothetical protein n=1 Tax=Terrabacter sp. 2YAF2 TaxID=3233026 RepID=UPI003F9AEBB7